MKIDLSKVIGAEPDAGTAHGWLPEPCGRGKRISSLTQRVAALMLEVGVDRVTTKTINDLAVRAHIQQALLGGSVSTDSLALHMGMVLDIHPVSRRRWMKELLAEVAKRVKVVV